MTFTPITIHLCFTKDEVLVVQGQRPAWVGLLLVLLRQPLIVSVSAIDRGTDNDTVR